MIVIRRAEEGDIPRIAEIELEAISPPWTHGALLSEIYRDDSFFVLAADSGAVLGFCILRRMGDDGELLKIAVCKPRRRQGIADMLMKAALDYAEENSLEAVYLEVRESGEAAINLYNKHDLTPVGRRKEYYTRPVEDAVVMKREIC